MDIKRIAGIAGEFKRALEAGQEVADPKKWKDIGLMANRLALIATAVITLLKSAGIDLPVSDEAIILVSGVLAGLLCLANIVLTVATSKKMGK